MIGYYWSFVEDAQRGSCISHMWLTHSLIVQFKEACLEWQSHSRKSSLVSQWSWRRQQRPQQQPPRRRWRQRRHKSEWPLESMDCFNSWPLVLRRACSPVICIWIASVVMAWSEALKAATVITWHYRWCGVMPVGGPYRRQPSYLSIGGLNVTCIIYIIYTQNLGLYIIYIYILYMLYYI